MDLFIDNKDKIPKNFLLFNTLKVLVNRCQCNENIPMYIRIGKKKQNNNNLSNLEIFQPINIENLDERLLTNLTDMGFSKEISINSLIYNNNNLEEALDWIDNIKNNKYPYKTKALAYFYINYEFTKGLFELIDRFEIYKDNLKLFLEFKNRDDNKFNMYINIYLNKLYLYNIYKNNDLPKILIKLIDNEKVSICDSFKTDRNTIKIDQTHLSNDEIKLNSVYKRPLFQYQKNNVMNMKQIEHRIKNNNGFYDTFQLKKTNTNEVIDVNYVFNIKSINENIFLSRGIESEKLEMMSEADLDLCKLYFRGGILSDDIGLGKTSSMIGLVMESYSDQTSFVLCPTRLCNQSEQEIETT